MRRRKSEQAGSCEAQLSTRTDLQVITQRLHMTREFKCFATFLKCGIDVFGFQAGRSDQLDWAVEPRAISPCISKSFCGRAQREWALFRRSIVRKAQAGRPARSPRRTPGPSAVILWLGSLRHWLCAEASQRQQRAVLGDADPHPPAGAKRSKVRVGLASSSFSSTIESSSCHTPHPSSQKCPRSTSVSTGKHLPRPLLLLL